MMPTQAKKIWQQACDEYLQGQVSALSYNTWFSKVDPYLKDDATIALSVPDDMIREHIEDYMPLVRKAISRVSREPFDVVVEVGSEQRQAAVNGRSKPSEPTIPARRSSLNPNLTFDNFIVGGGNELAYSASQSMANQHAHQFSPLYLYGGSGVGKTHLLHAIGNYVQSRMPTKQVVYIPTEQFVNEYIGCIKSNRFEEFRNKYRKADFLLIDDIQFLEGKEKMQEEFFHTFNTVHESGKFVALTCDKPPKSLSTLEDRITTRLSSGYTIDIQPPDYETRVAILNNLSEKHHVHIPLDVIEYMAKNITRNVRELEGAFKTLTAISQLGAQITLDVAQNVLKNIVQPGAVKVIDSRLVMDIVSNYYGVTVADLMSKRRSQDIVVPRQVAMYLCRSKTNMTLEEIGQAFGGKNHATVIHAYDKIKGELRSNTHLLEHVTAIEARLG